MTHREAAVAQARYVREFTQLRQGPVTEELARAVGHGDLYLMGQVAREALDVLAADVYRWTALRDLAEEAFVNERHDLVVRA